MTAKSWILSKGSPTCEATESGTCVTNEVVPSQWKTCVRNTQGQQVHKPRKAIALRRPVAAFGFIERVTTWQVLSPKTFSRTVPVILGPPMSFTGSWCK